MRNHKLNYLVYAMTLQSLEFLQFWSKESTNSKEAAGETQNKSEEEMY